MKNISLRSLEYSPGYGDMRGTRKYDRLMKNPDGNWVITSYVREYFDAPATVTVYEVSPQAVEQFEEFLAKSKVLSLARRRESKLFMTDYSPWDYSITVDDGAYGEYFSISQYKKYSKRDYRLLENLKERFYALRGRVLSETVEKEKR